ncbi:MULTISPECIES: helix-turn-helix domain-containing protein [Streptosporangium]|uniref:Helix-turn-helix domain-containing protein n=1 Tax=Streptosporangium jomthongense TaxID=1193683 RepID=A0ABV8F9Z5_9ACTN
MAQLTQADGLKIRRERERQELTVDELVARLAAEEDIRRHPDYIRNIELGYKQPSPRLLGSIARVLGVERDTLLGPENPRLTRRRRVVKK